jgi:protein-tyrosine phosphatase
MMTDQQKVPIPFPESYWVIPGLFLAGQAPSGYDEEESRTNISALIRAGIDVIIDLTQPGETYFAYPSILIDEASQHQKSVVYKNYPIKDRMISAPTVMKKILDEIDTQTKQGRRVYVHCLAGIGRTGTVVGCYLVRHGMNNEEVLGEIQHMRKDVPTAWVRSPESDEQVKLIQSWRKGQ